MRPDREFWRGKRVLLTGHTGFKGAWLYFWLDKLGAIVSGFSRAPDQSPNLFSILDIDDKKFGDLRDVDAIGTTVANSKPDLVIHMAAQALVPRSYLDPVETFATNIMGTINLMEALRKYPPKVLLNVTSDKVYQNRETGQAFKEDDPLGGDDPYSASKAATEIVTASYALSFLNPAGSIVATARAGNVIGGGDFSENRLVPDIWRATEAGKPLELRYPDATRPWQHVLEPLSGYLLFCEKLTSNPGLPRSLNFGPGTGETASVREIADKLSDTLGAKTWIQAEGNFPPEKQSLALDTSLASSSLGWHSSLELDKTLQWTADWYLAFKQNLDMAEFTADQIDDFEKLT